VEKFVYASSSSVYGNNRKIPFAEDDPVDHPISPYAATKKAGELLCHTYHHLHRLPIFCLRFFTVYGPRQRPEMAIHKFARLISDGGTLPVFGDGGTDRDYTYIDDIIDGVVRAIDRCTGYRIYNLGESQTTTLKRLIALLEESMGTTANIEHLPMQPGDVERTFADLTRSRAELGYDPAVPVERGIPLFVEWFRRRDT
jgi:UDP-glucuronate 4-epimerase